MKTINEVTKQVESTYALLNEWISDGGQVTKLLDAAYPHHDGFANHEVISDMVSLRQALDNIDSISFMCHHHLNQILEDYKPTEKRNWNELSLDEKKEYISETIEEFGFNEQYDNAGDIAYGVRIVSYGDAPFIVGNVNEFEKDVANVVRKMDINYKCDDKFFYIIYMNIGNDHAKGGWVCTEDDVEHDGYPDGYEGLEFKVREDADVRMAELEQYCKEKEYVNCSFHIVVFNEEEREDWYGKH